MKALKKYSVGGKNGDPPKSRAKAHQAYQDSLDSFNYARLSPYLTNVPFQSNEDVVYLDTNNFSNKEYDLFSSLSEYPVSSGHKTTYSVDRPKSPIPMEDVPSVMSPIKTPTNQQSIKEKELMLRELRMVKKSRDPQPIMKMDQSKGNRYGQYQIGERIWDEKRKQWVDRIWDSEDQEASRELARMKRDSDSGPKQLGSYSF